MPGASSQLLHLKSALSKKSTPPIPPFLCVYSEMSPTIPFPMKASLPFLWFHFAYHVTSLPEIHVLLVTHVPTTLAVLARKQRHELCSWDIPLWIFPEIYICFHQLRWCSSLSLSAGTLLGKMLTGTLGFCQLLMTYHIFFLTVMLRAQFFSGFWSHLFTCIEPHSVAF